MFVQFFVQYPVTVRMYACTCIRAASVDNESDNRILPSRVIFADVSLENERNLFSDALKITSCRVCSDGLGESWCDSTTRSPQTLFEEAE